MYRYDLVLYGVMTIIIIFLLREFFFLVRKNPDYWLFARTNQAYIKYWNLLEKVQPNQNTSILQFKKKERTKKT